MGKMRIPTADCDQHRVNWAIRSAAGLFLWILLLGCSARNLSQAPLEPSLVPTLQSVPEPTQEPNPTVWIDPALPAELKARIILPDRYSVLDTNTAKIHITISDQAPLVNWVYAAAVPFFTVEDEISLRRLRAIWQSGSGKILVTEETRRVFSGIWGIPDSKVVIKLPVEDWDDYLILNQDAIAIVPFDDLRPEWKVLRVDGVSPLDSGFSDAAYPLRISIGISGDAELVNDVARAIHPLESNYEPDRLTTLVMTGTTALARAIGFRMEEKGMTYPSLEIGPWLREADLTHVSNEVSFTPTCPPADFDQTSMMFCSRPEYLDLLIDSGVDIVELTGNHNLDWGDKPYLYSLELYEKSGIKVYAGGVNREEARKPLLIDHNGNKLAFLGCNYAGPGNAVAGVATPGAAYCDYEQFEEEIQFLRGQGYLPIITLQHYEYYAYKPSEIMERHFARMADAGAVIVQGSQSHFPMLMRFNKGAFIHYGLGNLFFDQMDRPVKGTRNEFIDRYTFYNGHLLSIELLTAILEDYSQPRPMTVEEREELLRAVFEAVRQME